MVPPEASRSFLGLCFASDLVFLGFVSCCFSVLGRVGLFCFGLCFVLDFCLLLATVRGNWGGVTNDENTSKINYLGCTNQRNSGPRPFK